MDRIFPKRPNNIIQLLGLLGRVRPWNGTPKETEIYKTGDNLEENDEQGHHGERE